MPTRSVWAAGTPVYVTQWGSEGNGYGQFEHPQGITVDSSGYVYVADTYNHRIQQFGLDSTPR